MPKKQANGTTRASGDEPKPARKKKSTGTRKLKDKPQKLEVSPEEQAKKNKMLRETAGIILGLIAIFILICIVAPKSTGMLGESIHYAFRYWFGSASYLLPILVLYVGISLIFSGSTIAPHWHAILVYLLFMDAVLFVKLLHKANLINKNGGVIGQFMADYTINMIGIAGAFLFSMGLGAVLLIFLTRITMEQVMKGVLPVFSMLGRGFKRMFRFLSFSHEHPEEEPLENAPLETVPDLSSLEDKPAKPIVLQHIDSQSVVLENGKTPDLSATLIKPGNEKPPEQQESPVDESGELNILGTKPEHNQAQDSDEDEDDDEEILPPVHGTEFPAPGSDIPGVESDEEDTAEMDLPPGPPLPNGKKNGNGNGKNPDPKTTDGIDLPPFLTGPPDGKPTGYDKLHGMGPDSTAEETHFQYELPPVSLLKGVEKEAEEKSAQDYSKLLEETLANFGVEVKVINKIRGPAVTRYELQPARGVKVKKVTSLANDIALSLAAYSIRIEAPIPGRSAIGIEVPNHRIDPVSMRDILVEGQYKKQPKIMLALGKDITGKPVLDNLMKMPHLLIAGSTGSGKSVCINCLIASILYTCTPLDVQMIMVDPKRVELSLFEGIPHLVDIRLPGGKKIITDPKAATLALKTVCEIMDQRYEDFVELKVRNIKEYNRKAEVPLPYIIVIIDELADLMMVSSQAVEQYICRIAQLGRASGIHLIVATQRPSVDVITGLIKANIPSRIAFAVSSQIDSRTILDRAGAEKLLGKGDMLYQPVDANEPRRVQGAYVSSEETEQIVEFWKMQPPPENSIPIEITGDLDKRGRVVEGGTPFEEETDKDPLIPEAIEIIRQTRQASVSNLQRKMKIGYARAGRLMDQLEQMGIVGPADGSKPRKINLPGFDLEGMSLG